MTNLQCCCGLPMIVWLSDESKSVHKRADRFISMAHAFYMYPPDCTYEMTSQGGNRREMSREGDFREFILPCVTRSGRCSHAGLPRADGVFK